MSIPTNQLQALASPKAADAILMANSAGGTAQLSLTNLAKFLAEQDNAVRTALSSKAALSAQQTVEKTTVHSRTETVAAADLPAFIAALPRLLTENLVVNVTGSGSLPRITLTGFYGSGFLAISANENVKFTGGISVSGCLVEIIIKNARVSGFIESGTVAHTLHVYNSSYVTISDCVIDGSGKDALGELRHIAAGVRFSNVYFVQTEFRGCGTALYACVGSNVVAISCSGSDNTIGIDVYRGGIVYLAEGTPDLLGGKSNFNECGLIVTGSGTLL